MANKWLIFFLGGGLTYDNYTFLTFLLYRPCVLAKFESTKRQKLKNYKNLTSAIYPKP